MSPGEIRRIERWLASARVFLAVSALVAIWMDPTVIGYSILIFYWSNEYGGDVLHIDELYVKPEHRGRGVATSFFKEILRTAKDKTVALELEVTPRNTRALRYYKRLGFKETTNLHLMRPS
jgi:ribosomal protein S18 acetylase RimI-like enzyme